jgi:hypothetical protein
MADVMNSLGSVLQDAVNYVQSALTPTQALDYIRSNYAAFRGVGPTIIKLQQQAKNVAVDARAKGRDDIANEMVARINTLGQINVFAGNVLDQIDTINSFMAQWGLPGFGVVAIPVAYVAIIAAVVGAMVYVFFHVNEQSQAIDAQQKVLSLVQARVLTPQEGLAYAKAATDTAAQSTSTGLAGALSSLKGMLVPIAVVAGAVYLVPLLVKGGKRGR